MAKRHAPGRGWFRDPRQSLHFQESQTAESPILQDSFHNGRSRLRLAESRGYPPAALALRSSLPCPHLTLANVLRRSRLGPCAQLGICNGPPPRLSLEISPNKAPRRSRPRICFPRAV